MVQDRTATAVTGWLARRERRWLAQIGVVALDPHRGYARAVTTHLAHATLVVDHFHLIRLANQVIDDVRRRVQQQTTGHRGRKHDPLYGIRKLLIKACDDLDAPGWARLGAGLNAGNPDGEIHAAWQLKRDHPRCRPRPHRRPRPLHPRAAVRLGRPWRRPRNGSLGPHRRPLGDRHPQLAHHRRRRPRSMTVLAPPGQPAVHAQSLLGFAWHTRRERTCTQAQPALPMAWQVSAIPERFKDPKISRRAAPRSRSTQAWRSRLSLDAAESA